MSRGGQRHIPTMSRYLVRTREMERCLRCGSPSGAQWHHRRSRGVHAPHRHCPCNGVWLCATCHKWVHDHPTLAMEKGLIVSRAESDPGSVPVTAHFGTVLLACDGTFKHWVEEI